MPLLRITRLVSYDRSILQVVAGKVGGLALLGLLCSAASAANLPNILWITSEDNGPQLGCYGDAYATTPNIDGLAARGVKYLHAWSCAPVCAPARTAIVSGLYPAAAGAEHMRSQVRLPASMPLYPQLLRQAGYYCSNNSKTDYNLREQGKVWDQSSNKAHWKNRRPGQPFFAVFNHVVSHESQIRTRPHTPVHDPAKVRLPAYHPDTPEVRLDWAQYYDKITEMDALVGRNLQELNEAGLADDTVVFYYGDHGSGMPRSKRWPYNSGLHVPLIVFIPEKFRHLAPKDYHTGASSDRLVSFVDLAPTLLSLAGIKPPVWMHGHAFLGPFATTGPRYLYGCRGRMDERYDLVRSVRDHRYIYVRNFMPHKIYGQFIDYMFQTPTTRIWKQLYDQGKLSPPQTYFWETKPPEELYDLASDPDEVHNLASSPAHQGILRRLRKAQRNLALDIRDVGFLPEDEIHARAQDATPYEVGHDKKRYDVAKVLKMAESASSLDAGVIPQLKRGLASPDSAVRYWAALGFLMRGRQAVASHSDHLRKALEDNAPSVRIVAAEALGKFGDPSDLNRVLSVLMTTASLEHNSVYVCLQALNALDELGPKTAPVLDQIKALPTQGGGANARTDSYIPRLIEHLGGGQPPARRPSAGTQAPGLPRAEGFDFSLAEDRLVLTHSGKLVAHYVFNDAEILRPYFAHLHTPDGIQVTRNHPPVAGQDPVDHGTMHPGLWLAFGDISGQDFWRNQGAIRHERFIEPPAMRDHKLVFATQSTLLSRDGMPMAELVSRIALGQSPGAYRIDWDAAFTPVMDGFTFGDQEEMGFGARVTTALAERNGGLITSNTGDKTAKVTWGQAYAWCDYSGTVGGRRAGIVLMPDPNNFRPSWWHNRDYGLFLANPFGRQSMKQGQKSTVTVERGATFRLRFSAAVHSSEASSPANPQEFYRQYLAETGSKP